MSMLSVRPATEADRQPLANLLHFESYVHRHLDWKQPLDWIGQDPYLLLVRNSQVVGALACPPDPPEIAWIRVFASSASVPLKDTWELLWTATRERLDQLPSAQVAALALQKWFSSLLQKSGFRRTHNVVVLIWERGTPLSVPRQAGYTIRPMVVDDLVRVCKIDEQAFSPVWRISLASIELAFLQSNIATVVENSAGVIGYQISTATPLGGHLARLAILPNWQGKGAGYALVYELLHQLASRGAAQVTVSTQDDNLASLSLYRRAGFHNTGEIYQVFED